MDELILIVAHFVGGFIHSALMARWFEHTSDDDIFFNMFVWEILVIGRTARMMWRLAAGYSPSRYKKRHYIWSR